MTGAQSGASGLGWSPGSTSPHPDLGPLPLCLAFFTCTLGLVEAPVLEGCSEDGIMSRRWVPGTKQAFRVCWNCHGDYVIISSSLQ